MLSETAFERKRVISASSMSSDTLLHVLIIKTSKGYPSSRDII